MEWGVAYHEEYLAELRAESQAVQVSVVALAELLKHFGPQLSRPYVDTLKGSTFPNMKELRMTLPEGEWRIALPSIRNGRRSC